jgi:hypothetical protein
MRSSNRWREMRRREFIALLGSAAIAWPLAAHTQQPAMPVVGFLRSTAAVGSEHIMTAFLRGLKEADLSTARTSRSSTAGLIIKTIDCRRWRLI